MQKIEVAYSHVPFISSKDLNYIELEPFLKEFYTYTPEIKAFAEAIQNRKNFPVNRELLVSTLQNQYKSFPRLDTVDNNIAALGHENTYTIVTAHQPSLMTGPLYYIYKTASIINLCCQLKTHYPDYSFVPVFVSGGEDHDFEEINHMRVFSKNIVWEADQTGAVGRMNTEGLDQCIEAIGSLLGNRPYAENIVAILQQASKNAKSYGEINRRILHELFGNYGLVTLSMDDSLLKKEFSSCLKKELVMRPSASLVQETQNSLENHGFKAQAHARDINLFYLTENNRNRITYLDGSYHIVDTEVVFSEEEICEELENYPDRFSPNVIMRPIYQEYSLPNLAYVGGGGEVAYWLERKSQFSAYGVNFPMLIRRSSAMLIDQSVKTKLDKIDLSPQDILKESHVLIHDLLQAKSTIDIDLTTEKNQLIALWNAIAEKANAIDPTLSKASLSELNKHIKSIDSMESRIRRKLKSDDEVNVKRIESLKEILFPENSLQERKDNIWQFYSQYGQNLIDYLVDNLNPMHRKFLIITLE